MCQTLLRFSTLSFLALQFFIYTVLCCEDYFVNVQECFAEFQKYYHNRSAACKWQRQEMRTDFLQITCANKLVIDKFNKMIADLSVQSSEGTHVAASELIDYIMKSLQELSAKNGFPFELIMHLNAVNSTEEFIKRIRTTRNMELYLDDKTFYYRLTECGFQLRQVLNRKMTLRTALQMNLTNDFFAGMDQLSYLGISGIELENLTTDLLKPVSKLTFLDIKCKSNTQATFLRGILKNTPHLHTLKIRYCGIAEFPDNMLSNLTKITLLDFSHNHIKYIPHDFFQNQSNLDELYLNGNELEVLDAKIFEHLPRLRTLDCSDNRLINFPSKCIKPHTGLSYLKLENNLLRDDITAVLWRNFPKLAEVNLRHNRISSLELEFLFENITEIQTEYYKYDLKPEELIGDLWETLDLSENPMTCYCSPYIAEEITLAREFYRIPHLPAVNVSCKLWKGYTIEIPLSKMFNRHCQAPKHIDNSSSCPNGCLCYTISYGNMYAIDCAFRNLFEPHKNIDPTKRSFQQIVMDVSGNNLQELPVNTNPGFAATTKLIALNNSLQQLNVSNIPPLISYLDLRGNKLEYIDENVIGLLNSTTVHKKFKLSGNPWKCDCRLKPFLNFLKTHKKFILDKDAIYCEKDSKKFILIELSITDICPVIEKSVPVYVTILELLGIIML